MKTRIRHSANWNLHMSKCLRPKKKAIFSSRILFYIHMSFTNNSHFLCIWMKLFLPKNEIFSNTAVSCEQSMCKTQNTILILSQGQNIKFQHQIIYTEVVLPCLLPSSSSPHKKLFYFESILIVPRLFSLISASKCFIHVSRLTLPVTGWLYAGPSSR